MTMTTISKRTENDSLLRTTQDVANRLQVHVQTVKNWRVDGTGPKFVRLGNGKLIRYRDDDIEEWINQQVQQVSQS